MQLEAIKVFCDLASLRSFSKAAAVNDRSQPAVSRVVHELERRLGGKLIDRSRRPLHLTALGQAYYEGCKRILEQYLELEASLMSAPTPLGLNVHVVAIFSVGLAGVSDYIARFEARHPHARVHMEYIHPEHVYERVREGTVDFGLVSFPRPAKDLAVLPWRDEEMVIACSPRHPLAAFSSVPVEKLDGQKFVAFEHRLTIRREVDKFFRDHGVNVEVEVEVDSVEHVKKWIEQRAGLSLLPEPVLRQEAAAGLLKIVRIEGGRMTRPLGIIYRKRQPPGCAVQDFIDILRGNEAARPSPTTNGHVPPRPRAKRTVP